MHRLWSILARVDAWPFGVWGLVLVGCLLIVPLGSLWRGDYLAGIFELGMVGAYTGLLRWLPRFIAREDGPSAAALTGRDRVSPRVSWHPMEVRQNAAEEWYLHDLGTGDDVPLEVGDLFYVVHPSALPKEEG